MSAPTKQIRGIRQGIRAGSVLGRRSPGTGAVEEITLGDLVTSVVSTGQVITSGGANPQNWTAGKVGTIAPGITVTAGTLVPDWQAGTVTVLGPGITLVSGTLSATGAIDEWQAGTVVAVGAHLSINSGTLNVSGISPVPNGMLPLVNGDPLTEMLMNVPGPRDPAHAILARSGGRVPYDAIFTTDPGSPIPTGPGIIADPYGQMIGVPL